jgi:LysR family transcriptional regulator for bpeEF and oprC
MDQLYCMRIFTRVVDQGSFAGAANELSVSRPTVTTGIAQLEKRVGVRLLHRTTRRLSLTDEGRAYYESCLRILNDIAEAEDSLSKTRTMARGRLRVSLPHSFSRLPFFPALPRFLKRHPELTLEVVMSDRASNLVEEGIDCAARGVAIPDDATLVARRLVEARWTTVASPAYLAAHGTPKEISDLAKHNCIRFNSPSTGRVVEWQFESLGKRIAYGPHGNLAVNALEAAASAALAGIGIAQVPDPLINNHVESGALKPLLVDLLAPAPDFCIVYPSNRYLTAKVRAFADFITEFYPRNGWWQQTGRKRKSKK